MKRTTRYALVATLGLAASQLGACHAHVGPSQPTPEIAVQEKGGPPPHAPAHGYRRKHPTAHQDVELVFDAGLGVYVVVGFPGVYFEAEHFFRFVGTSWQISIHPDSGWRVAAQDAVPPGLRKQKHGKAKGGGRPVPAKQRD